MKTKKKLSVLLICVAVVFCLGCAFAFTACGGDDKALTYKLNSDGDGYKVLTYSTDVKKVEIPSEHNGLPVTEIDSCGFSECKSLTSITIPDSVTIIYNGAFMECTSLTSITIPDSVTYMGTSVFMECTSLTSITIPDSVTYLGSMAFAECTKLENATLGSGITSIGHHTFEDCTALTSITLPSSVGFIQEGAFSGCASLTDVYFKGTSDEWDNLDIDEDDNENFISAAVHFI